MHIVCGFACIAFMQVLPSDYDFHSLSLYQPELLLHAVAIFQNVPPKHLIYFPL